jgi:cAMP-dependent protein kinase regulator
LLELCLTCGEQPENNQLRIELVGVLAKLGENAKVVQLVERLTEQLIDQGLTLLALALLTEAAPAAADDPSSYKEALINLYRDSSSIDEIVDLDDLETKLGGGAEEHVVPTEAELRAMSHESLIDEAVRVATCLAPHASRGLPLPLPLFSEMSEQHFVEAVPKLRRGTIVEGGVLIEQGAISQTIYVIVSGSVNVTRGGKRLARLGPGTVVGEMALLTAAPRSATVIATEPVMFIELACRDIIELSVNSPGFQDELRHFCHHRLLQNVVRTSPLFSHFDIPTGSLLILAFQPVELREGRVMVEYDSEGQGVWVLTSGQVSVQVQAEGGGFTEVARLNAGDIVGEISLLKKQNTTARVVALGQVSALFLDKKRFYEVLEEHVEVGTYLEGLSTERLDHLGPGRHLELGQSNLNLVVV